MNEESVVRRALNNAIENQSFELFNSTNDFDDMLEFAGKRKQFHRELALQQHYQGILEENLNKRDRDLLESLVDCLNLQCGYIAEAMYRRGAMEAFGLFRMFLDADDRRTATC